MLSFWWAIVIIVYYLFKNTFSSVIRRNTLSNVCPVQLCGVSILRAGEVLEPALLSVCKDTTLGKILIQTNESTGEPEVPL